MVHHLVAIIDLNIFLAHKDGRNIVLTAIVDKSHYFIMWNKIFANGGIAINTQGTCSENIAVHKVLHLRYIVE